MTGVLTTSPTAPAGTTVPDRPAMPRTPLDRLRWTVVDSWTMAVRNLALLVRRSDEIVLGLSLPVIFVLMFGYVLGGAISLPGGGSYREFILPGIFAMIMLYGVASTGTGVATDATLGVIDRFRAIPMARSAVVVGRSIADMIRASGDVAILVVCGLLIGWRWHNGIVAALAAIGLVLLLRLAFIFVGIYLGLIMRTPDGAALAVYPAAFPLTMLSNGFVPPSTMPTWLGVVAEWNPVSATVTAIRKLFGNPGITGDSWAVEHATLLAVGWPLVLLAIFVPLSVRRYQRLSR